MRSKTIINDKGELKKARIEISVTGRSGELGVKAVTELIALIEGLKDMETPQDVTAHYHMICGFALCSMKCGILEEKSVDDLMHLVELLVDNELVRVNGQK